jgi:glycosyltransferase involved in cell wall biosynthesis
MNKITIIIPFLNEGEEPLNTIQSIYSTCNPSLIDIIAVDDCSTLSFTDFSSFPDVLVIRNGERIGCSASIHKAVEIVQTPYIFIIDGHMRFRNDHWYERIISALDAEPETLFCTTCVALSKDMMVLAKSKQKYYGANLLLIDNSQSGSIIAGQIIEPKWANKKPGKAYEIPCVLGANYAISVEWFKKIKGIEGLQKWGGLEAFLSLKTWLSGGKCKILKDIEIGHMFRDNAPYITQLHHLHYNKMFICLTIFPEELSNHLINQLPNVIENSIAKVNIGKNWQIIQETRRYYQTIFKKDIYEVCDLLDIEIPQFQLQIQ